MLIKASYNVYGLFLLCFYVVGFFSLSIVCKSLHVFLLALCYFDCLFFISPLGTLNCLNA